MTATFDPAYRQLMHFENPSGDPDGSPHTEPRGGFTRFGISERYWGHLVDVRKLTATEAREFYRREFWQRYRIERLEAQQVATVMFLGLANMSPGRPVRALQRAARAAISAECLPLAAPEVDGLLGPLTAAAANACSEQVLAAALRSEIVREYVELYHEDPTAAWAIGGWTRRGYLDGLPAELRADLCRGERAREAAAHVVKVEAEPGEPGSEEDDAES